MESEEKLVKEEMENKEEVILEAVAVEGAKKAESELRSGTHIDHCHVLMSQKYNLNLLEVNHRTIEEIEKARYRIIAKFEGDEAVEEFRKFVFSKLIAE